MRIHFELYASLMRYLPAGAARHRVTLEVPEDITANQLLGRFGIPPAEAKLVVLNGEFVPETRRDHAQMHEGDVLAVWPPVAGG